MSRSAHPPVPCLPLPLEPPPLPPAPHPPLLPTSLARRPPRPPPYHATLHNPPSSNAHITYRIHKITYRHYQSPHAILLNVGQLAPDKLGQRPTTNRHPTRWPAKKRLKGSEHRRCSQWGRISRGRTAACHWGKSSHKRQPDRSGTGDQGKVSTPPLRGKRGEAQTARPAPNHGRTRWTGPRSDGKGEATRLEHSRSPRPPITGSSG